MPASSWRNSWLLHGQCGLLGEQLAATVGVDRLASFLPALSSEPISRIRARMLLDAGLGSVPDGSRR